MAIRNRPRGIMVFGLSFVNAFRGFTGSDFHWFPGYVGSSMILEGLLLVISVATLSHVSGCAIVRGGQ